MKSGRTLLHCFLRSFLVGAGMNGRGMQNIGLLFALWPGLKSIHSTPEARRLAYRRYAGHYNCHPLWTPLLIGMFLRLEDLHSRGLLPAEMLDRLRNATVHTLSAIGDSFFEGSLLVFWAVSTSLLAVNGGFIPALVWCIVFTTATILFKCYVFFLGWRSGLSALNNVKCWNLINRGDTLKMINAVLCAALFTLLLNQCAFGGLTGIFRPTQLSCMHLFIFAGAVLCFWGLSLLSARFPVPRFFAPLLALAVLALTIVFM